MGADISDEVVWDELPLSELTSTNVTYGVVQPGVPTADGVPMVRVNNFSGHSLTLAEVMRISHEVERKYERTRLQPGDVLITVVGSVGQVAIVPPELAGWNIARAVALIRPKLGLARWIAHFLRSPIAQHRMGIAANTTVQTTVNLKDLRSMSIPMPSEPIRRGISDLLGTLDDRVDLLRQTNTTLEAIAQALFKSWFVDFDPVHAKAEGREPEAMDAATAALFPSEFEESELGLIPKGWQASSLSELCGAYGGLIQTGPFGSQLHASDYTNEGVPVVMPQDLADRRISVERIARVSEADATRLTKHRLVAGDIVFSRRGDVGRHAMVADTDIGSLCGTGCLLVRPGQKHLISAFVSSALARPESLEWLVRHAVGATMPNLNTSILSSLPIIKAPESLMLAYGEIADPVERRISLNHAKARSLAALRDTLLPRLISGKLRLLDAEREIKAAV